MFDPPTSATCGLCLRRDVCSGTGDPGSELCSVPPAPSSVSLSTELSLVSDKVSGVHCIPPHTEKLLFVRKHFLINLRAFLTLRHLIELRCSLPCDGPNNYVS